MRTGWMQVNNGSGQEPFAPKTQASAVDGLDATIDGRIGAAGLATSVDLAAHAGRIDNPHGVTAAQVGAVTPAQLDTALQGERMAQLWSGSWASGSITLAQPAAGYRLLVLVGAGGTMVIRYGGAAHASTRNLWGNAGTWHVVDNIYYLAINGTQLTMAHSQKMLNGTAVGAGDAIVAVFGIK